MPPAVRPAALAVCAALALAAVGQARELAGRDDGPATGKAVVQVTAGAPIADLYPGASRPLAFRVTNRFDRRIVVSSLHTGVTVAAGSPGCWATADSFVVRITPKPRFAIRPGRTKTVATTVSMPHTAPDACQGARFRVTLTAEATR